MQDEVAVSLQVLNGDKKDAIATMALVLGQHPENETYMNYMESLKTEEG